MHARYASVDGGRFRIRAAYIVIFIVAILASSGFTAFFIVLPAHHIGRFKYLSHLERISIKTSCFVKNYHFVKQGCSLYYTFWGPRRCRQNCACYDERFKVLYRIKNGSELISTIRLNTWGRHEKEVNSSDACLYDRNNVTNVVWSMGSSSDHIFAIVMGSFAVLCCIGFIVGVIYVFVFK